MEVHVCRLTHFYLERETFFPMQETQWEKQVETGLLQMFIDIAAALSKVHPV